MSKLVWFRSDLRVQDNMALSYASRQQATPVRGVYYITPAQWQAHDMAACKVDLILRSLNQLRTALAGIGIPLDVFILDDFAAIPEHLLNLCQQYGITEVCANIEYPINERKRDLACQQRLEQAQITLSRFHDFVVHPPGSLLTGQGDYYKVFTPFKRSWYKHLSNVHYDNHSVEEHPPCAPADTRIPETLTGFESHIPGHLWPAGEDAAWQALVHFCEKKIQHYSDRRDRPDLDDTSRVSAYLAIGSVSIRQCLRMAFTARAAHPKAATQIDVWINELIWRDFYQHVLVGFPQVCRYRAMQEYTEAIPWNSNQDMLHAWQQGETGIPIVDAAMKQLLQTGWMHNRLRMITAMFLSKNLLIDWRAGEKHFMRHLIDGEFGANNGGWQWAASTGTDAAPYFRIFNPVSQSQKFDPQGDFIRQYLPALSGLSDKAIHAPWEGKDLLSSPDYPAPIVDLKRSRQDAIDTFKSVRGETH